MRTSGAATRHKLYDYIRVADDKKLSAIYHLIEGDIEQTADWWKDKTFTKELDRRSNALETGTDKGITLEALESSIGKLRKKKYGR